VQNRLSRRRRRISGADVLILLTGLVAAITSGIWSYRADGPYGERRRADPRARRIYDPTTGELKVLAYDASGDLRLDRWSYMEAGRLVRMDADDNGDGTVDRREYFDAQGNLERTEYMDGNRTRRIEISRSKIDNEGR
jgi:hypothetical protein